MTYLTQILLRIAPLFVVPAATFYLGFYLLTRGHVASSEHLWYGLYGLTLCAALLALILNGDWVKFLNNTRKTLRADREEDLYLQAKAERRAAQAGDVSMASDSGDSKN